MEGEDANWGVGQVRELSEMLEDLNADTKSTVSQDAFVIADDFAFPLEFIYQVSFITGMRGSGKSWTAAVLMEEFERLGLQFVCFDPLDAHGHLSQLPGIQRISPKNNESINCAKLVSQLKDSNSCLIVDLSNLTLESQQDLIAEYCEALIQAKMGKGLLTIFEECQDFVPLQKRNSATAPIIRLCKLGRALGYGVCMVTQRPAAITKEALSQASTYVVHNVMQTRDLIAIKDQISYGTDKERIDRLVEGIAFAQSGECIIYSPEFLKDEGFLWIGKIRGDRRTEHKGKNIEVRPNIEGYDSTTYDVVETSTMHESDSLATTSTPPSLPVSMAEWEVLPPVSEPVQPTLTWTAPPTPETVPEPRDTFGIMMIGGFLATTGIALALLTKGK
jgi:hypothetical protein